MSYDDSPEAMQRAGHIWFPADHNRIRWWVGEGRCTLVRPGLPAEAERCYRRAFSVMPNRIYPLYRLMKLYDEQGRRADCLRMARRVAAFDVKVESEATREMKREAEEIVFAGKLQRKVSSGNPAKIWRETK